MKNTVELHFSKNNFFDNQGFNLFGQNEDYYNYGLGLTYFRGLDFKNSIYLLSELHFAQVILRGNNLDVGGISEREVYFFTIGHSYKLFEKSKFQIRTLAGLNYRIGDEQMVVGYPYDWEVRLHGIMLSDFGTSVGLKLLYELPFNLQISLETIY